MNLDDLILLKLKILVVAVDNAFDEILIVSARH
jgi:hypothetical protein